MVSTDYEEEGNTFVICVSETEALWPEESAKCGETVSCYDHVEPMQWRHLNVFNKECVIVSALPSVLAGPITNSANGHVYYLLNSNTWTASEAKAFKLGGHGLDSFARDWLYDGLIVASAAFCLTRGVLFSGGHNVCYTHTDADIDATLRAYRAALEILADATTRVANDLQSLRDQLANGTPITDADLQSVKQDIAGVANIDPGAPPSETHPAPVMSFIRTRRLFAESAT